MKQQSYSSHSRYVPGFHFLTASLILIVFLYNTFRMIRRMIQGILVFNHFFYWYVVPFLVSMILVLLFLYCRRFALAAQDRAIRAEEGLRYFILTGKAIDPRITMSQIIALRFAADDEMAALVQQAAEKGMTGDDIKKSIKNWRPDNHRA